MLINFDQYIMAVLDRLLLWFWNQFEIKKLEIERVLIMLWTAGLVGLAIADANATRTAIYILLAIYVWYIDFRNRIRNYVSDEAENLRVYAVRQSQISTVLRWVFIAGIIALVAYDCLTISTWSAIFLVISTSTITARNLVSDTFVPVKPPRRRKRSPAVKLAWTPALIPIPVSSR